VRWVELTHRTRKFWNLPIGVGVGVSVGVSVGAPAMRTSRSLFADIRFSTKESESHQICTQQYEGRRTQCQLSAQSKLSDATSEVAHGSQVVSTIDDRDQQIKGWCTLKVGHLPHRRRRPSPRAAAWQHDVGSPKRCHGPLSRSCRSAHELNGCCGSTRPAGFSRRLTGVAPTPISQCNGDCPPQERF
jgi:hypothetical protein